MILDLDTCLNKSAFRYSFKRDTNLLKHVSNDNQERLNLKVKERERRDSSKLGNPLSRGVCWWKVDGLCSLEVLKNWRTQTRATKRSRLITCINSSILAQKHG